MLRFACAALVMLSIPVPAEAQSTVILVRHAEQMDDGTRDPALSPEGQERAAHLASMLRNSGITAVISTPFKRTLETATPVAELTGLAIDTVEVSRNHIEDVVEAVLGNPVGSTVLVVGHSNTIPAIANALAGTELPDFDETEYDNMLIIHLDGSTRNLTRLRFGNR